MSAFCRRKPIFSNILAIETKKDIQNEKKLSFKWFHGRQRMQVRITIGARDKYNILLVVSDSRSQ